MAIRKILVPLSGQYDPEDPQALDVPALRTGLTVGARFAAHVEVFCIAARPGGAPLADWVPDYAMDDLIDRIEQESAARRARARAVFEAVCAGLDAPRRREPGPEPGLSVDFLEETGEIRDALARRGRLADLIVTAHAADGDGSNAPLLLDVALRETGRPLLISPASAVPSLGDRVAVAWNGSQEAARAVAMALPFLERAEAVHVITVEEDGGDLPGAADLAEYLRWHGIAAETRTAPAGAGGAGAVLLAEAARAGADLLVMGAYTRDRLRRLIFGDVTGAVLAHAPLPVLMVD